MENSSKVLIVGAGAGGFVTGYYFALSGADVTFYVREKRMEQLKPPQSLYSYDDCELKQFTDYGLICDMQQVAERSYDFVLVTFDSHTSFSEEGTQLLENLGKAVEDTEAVVVNLGVGVGIKEHFLKTTGLDESRILSGSFAFLSHFVASADLSRLVHPPANQEEVGKAYVAYRHIGGKGGLIIDNKSRDNSMRFAELYNRNGISKCTTAKPVSVDLRNNISFPLFAASELLGWADTEITAKDKTVWPLACKAVNEIAALPEFGLPGKIQSIIMRVPLWSSVWLKVDKASLPLDFNSFNQLHHGGKVVAQDTEIMRQNLAIGQQAGKQMPHLQELLDRLDAYRG